MSSQSSHVVKYVNRDPTTLANVNGAYPEEDCKGDTMHADAARTDELAHTQALGCVEALIAERICPGQRVILRWCHRGQDSRSCPAHLTQKGMGTSVVTVPCRGNFSTSADMRERTSRNLTLPWG